MAEMPAARSPDGLALPDPHGLPTHPRAAGIGAGWRAAAGAFPGALGIRRARVGGQAPVPKLPRLCKGARGG